MKKIFFSILLLFFCSISFAQNDFIVVKKKARTLKSLFTGSQVSFTTAVRYYSGKVDAVVNDSLYLLEYDVRKMQTNLGIYILDTIAVYRNGVHYTEILRIQNERKGFNVAASGASLLGGGILLTTIGLGTWIFTKEGEQYHASPKLVIGSAILGAAGYAILKLSGNGYKIGKKYKLNYVKTK